MAHFSLLYSIPLDDYLTVYLISVLLMFELFSNFFTIKQFCSGHPYTCLPVHIYERILLGM